MADILEFIQKDSTFLPVDVIDEKITSLLVQLYQYKTLTCVGVEQEIIENWRNQLYSIRAAIHGVLDEE